MYSSTYNQPWRYKGRGVVVNVMPQPLYPGERDPVPTVQEAG